MKADTFAKLVVLDTLVEAEIGYYCKHFPPSPETFRRELATRVGALIDEIDALDSVVAGRCYDAIVDLLADLPEGVEGIVDAAAGFRRALGRIIERGIDRRDLAIASTWAIVLEELLLTLSAEYQLAVAADGALNPREYGRAEALLDRSRQTVDRMLWHAEVARPEIVGEMDRLNYVVRYRRLPHETVEAIVRSLRRRVSRFRPSTITRVGAFVLRQLISRDPKRLATVARKARAKRAARKTEVAG